MQPLNVTASTVDAAAAHATDEWRARVDLAALYRLFAHFGWTDLIYTHIAARVPKRADRYFIQPYGALFEDVTASSLIEVDFDGHAVGGTRAYNRAGHAIHATVLQARPEINFILHSHTRAGAAVSAMRCGLLPLSQAAMVVLSTVAYHPYAVSDESPAERARLVADLGDKYVLVLHNHGLLVCGRTAAEAFLYHYFIQSACEIQLQIMSATDEYVMPPKAEMAKLTAWSAPRAEPWGAKPWAALLGLLDRVAPSYKY